MFLLNSRLGHFSATSPSLEEAPLIPKLQGQFAEFLSRDSLEHLGILYPDTCVGLRYGFPSTEAQRLFLEAPSLLRRSLAALAQRSIPSERSNPRAPSPFSH